VPHASINGLRLYYERHGEDGDPLVFVHGYVGDSRAWRLQSAEFAKTNRVLLMDHRGHGRSEAPADRALYTIERMADDIEALAAQAAFERYHLVGHSMGGSVAQEIALRSPQRLLSLTLEDVGFMFGTSATDPIRGVMAGLYAVAEAHGMGAIAAMGENLPSPPHMPKDRIAEERELLSKMSVDAFIGAGQAMENWQGTLHRAHQIAAPTLVICGELDAGVIGPARWLASNIPGATLEVIPEAGHSAQYERPQLFNAALQAHLGRWRSNVSGDTHAASS
jgi:pimeloyl-ACP methyl ester carboxylesterase